VCVVSVCALSLDSHLTIGNIVLDVFGDSVASLINSSLELATGNCIRR